MSKYEFEVESVQPRDDEDIIEDAVNLSDIFAAYVWFNVWYKDRKYIIGAQYFIDKDGGFMSFDDDWSLYEEKSLTEEEKNDMYSEAYIFANDYQRFQEVMAVLLTRQTVDSIKYAGAPE